MSIAENIAARKDAEEIVAFIGDKPAAFWVVLGAMCDSKLPPLPATVERNPPLTEQEAIALRDGQGLLGRCPRLVLSEVVP